MWLKKNPWIHIVWYQTAKKENPFPTEWRLNNVKKGEIKKNTICNHYMCTWLKEHHNHYLNIFG